MRFCQVSIALVAALLLTAGCGNKEGSANGSSAKQNAKSESKTAGTPAKDASASAKSEPKKPVSKKPPEPEEDTTASKEAVVKVKRLLRRWESEVREERNEAWEGLLDMGDLATPALIEVVKNGKSRVRRLAIKAIGLLKDKLGAEAIRGAMKDSDEEVRWVAARALGEIGDKQAKPLLVEAIKEDKNAEVRYHSAYALASLGGAEAFEYFKGQLKSEKVDDRSRAVRALGKYGKGKFVDDLVAALKDKEKRVRYGAIIQLEHARKKESIPALIVALEDEDRFVRKRSRQALEKLTDQDFGRNRPKWEKWWKANGGKFKVPARRVGPKPPEPIKFANAKSIANAADFKKLVTESKGFVLVDIYHPRGKNCRKFAPVFDKLAKEYKGKVAMYACAASRATVPIIRKLGVKVPPTTVVFKDGKAVEIFPGAKGADELKKAIDEHLGGKREVKVKPKAPGSKATPPAKAKQAFPDAKDAADFKSKVLEAKGLVLVDFHADWCGWCHKLKPVLNKLMADYKGKVVIVGVDSDKNKDLKAKYGVRGLPTMIVFKGGKEVEKVVGFRKEDALKTILDKHLKGGEK